MGTHYETLGVNPAASVAEIRKAYLRRARALHPDRQLGRPANEARASETAMRQVNEAWSVLSDPQKKAAYDQRGKARRTAGRGTATVHAHAAARSRPPTNEPITRVERGRSIDEQQGDGSVSVWASIPVLMVVGLLLGILVVTAFANREPSDNRPVIEQNDAELSVGDCFAFVGDVPRLRSCTSGTSDGQVVAIGPDSGNCPGTSVSIKDPSSDLFLCWARMLPGSTNTVP
ncbi:MAG: J domain-containing protein [Acidimicrobiales bacterium]